MSNIPVFAPCLGIDTMKHLTDALDVGWLGMGSTTKRFEDEGPLFRLDVIKDTIIALESIYQYERSKMFSEYNDVGEA